MRKTKYIYLCLMALFSITTFANGFDEFGGGGYGGGYGNSNSGGYGGGYGNSGGGTYNGGTLGTVYIPVTQPGYVVPPPYTPPSYVPIYTGGIVINNGPGGYYYGGGSPTETGTSTGTTPTNGTNLINKPVLTRAELDQLIKELKGAVTVKLFAYVDSQGNTRIGELTTITNPNVPSHHLLYFDEAGGTTDQVKLPDNQNGTVFGSNTNNSNYDVTPWNGNNPQPTGNPNSVWIQEPNTGTWYFITPTFPTTVVGAPPVKPVPPVKSPCEQVNELTTPGSSPSNDPNNGLPQNLLTDNIKMLKDKFANPPIPFTGLLTETNIDVKKNNLDFYSTKVNSPGGNFSAPAYTGTIYIGSIHNHPTNGVPLPSTIDLRLLLNTYDNVNPINRDEVFVMVVSKELNGNLVVYNLKINNIDKLRAAIKAVWDNPALLNITDKDKAIKDAEADYYAKAGNDKEKAFLQKNSTFGLDLYKSSKSEMNDWGKLTLDSDPATGALVTKKSNCN
jgi:hypothetical protein